MNLPEKTNENLEQAKLEFEREKHRDEIELRARELNAKIAQTTQSVWRSPVFLAIVAGIVGLISNAIVAQINGSSQRDLERTRGEATLILEQQKAEAERILEALRTGDPDKAAANLDLLVRTNLVKSEADKIRDYLVERQPGEGASLPVPTGAQIPPRIGGVVGEDDRISVEDTSRRPFNSICKIRTPTSLASGFFIHPRIIVLARFAITEEDLASALVIFGGDEQTSESIALASAELIHRTTGDDSLNYSFLVLPEDPKLLSDTFSIPETALSEEELRTSTIHFAGFPFDRSRMVYNAGMAVGVTDSHLYHLLDTGAGASGGPIWIKSDDNYIAVGVHLSTGGGENPGKVAIRLDGTEVRSMIQTALD